MMTLRVLLVAFALAPSARAVIAVKLPVAEIYDGSRTVVTGQVTKVNGESGTVEASAKALKGEFPGDIVRLKFEGAQKAQSAGIKVGDPLVLCTGAKAENFALHIADEWFLPEVHPAAPKVLRVANT